MTGDLRTLASGTSDRSNPRNLMLGRPKVATPPPSDQTFWLDQTDLMVDGVQEKQKSARSRGNLASESAPSGVLLQSRISGIVPISNGLSREPYRWSRSNADQIRLCQIRPPTSRSWRFCTFCTFCTWKLDRRIHPRGTPRGDCHDRRPDQPGHLCHQRSHADFKRPDVPVKPAANDAVLGRICHGQRGTIRRSGHESARLGLGPFRREQHGAWKHRKNLGADRRSVVPLRR